VGRWIATPGDAAHEVRLSRLELPRRQPEVCGHVRGLLETLRIIHRSIERQRSDRPDSVNVHEALDYLDAVSDRVDFLGQRCDLLDRLSG